MTKVILSRKGFDSSAGGGPSPIIDGKLMSLPIPQTGTGIRYSDLQWEGGNYEGLMSDLFKKRLGECHLDPDLDKHILPERPVGWKPSFGQAGAALSHLRNEKVGEGDMFLFFGWFREAEKKNGRWRFVPKAPDQHIIFAYLSIGDIWTKEEGIPPAFLRRHPHIHLEDHFSPKGNAIFLASDKNSPFAKAGAGTLNWKEERVLTQAGFSRSNWCLPAAFFTQAGQCKLSYHRHRKWKKPLSEDEFLLTIAPRGQEFVIPMDEGIRQWLREVM